MATGLLYRIAVEINDKSDSDKRIQCPNLMNLSRVLNLETILSETNHI